jgi:hypothetical protein
MSSPSDANSRINNLWERATLGLLSLFVTIMFFSYNNISKEVKDANDKIVLLQMDKVGKSDMRDFEVRTNSRMDAGFSSLAQRIDSNQQDILRQFQFYFDKAKSGR